MHSAFGTALIYRILFLGAHRLRCWPASCGELQEARRRRMDMRDLIDEVIIFMHRTLAMATAAVSVLLGVSSVKLAAPF